MTNAYTTKKDLKLARTFIVDEIFDLTLYKKFRAISQGSFAVMLDQLIKIETKHVQFWRDFFKLDINELNTIRTVKISIIMFFARIFGDWVMHLTLEAIEIYGVKKYLRVWARYKHEPLGNAVKEVLEDELEHEDTVVSAAIERQVNPDKIRNIFLGFNDGLVEILGAVSGFFAAFREPASILIAGVTVAVAGAISMATGAFVATSSEQEVKKVDEGKRRFLGQSTSEECYERPFPSAFVVGISYLIGAVIPLFPVFFGSKNILISIIASAVMIIIVSMILAFLSGMDTKKRIAMNLFILALAVAVTYSIGIAAKSLFGIAL